MTDVLLATRSRDKAREIGEILAWCRDLRIVTLEEAGIEPSPDEQRIEVFDTFLDNARAKAEWFGSRSNLPTLADDSGLCVDALDGAPGVRSRRFASDAERRGLDQDRANNAFLLERLRGVPTEQRGAAYVCAAVLRLPEGRFHEAIGSVRGVITEAPAGQSGFGYDPLFLLPGTGRTFGELAPAGKHAFSHRARAFRALAVRFDDLAE